MKLTGGCHCQQVRFEVEMNVDSAISCNCSICSKRGLLLSFTPESSFKLLSGENNLTDYQFGKKRIHHYFCKTCGVGSFGSGETPDGKKMCAINIRCLDDFEFSKVPLKHVDGKSF